MTEQHENHGVDLEFREFQLDSPPEEVLDYMITMGESPRVVIDFEGTVGVGLDKIRIDSTGFDAKELGDMLETLSNTLRGEPLRSEWRSIHEA